MPLPIRARLSPEVMGRSVGIETVLLDIPSGRYFGLNEVGTVVWQGLQEGWTTDQICKRLVSEFNVERSRLEGDVGQLLDALAAQGLVTLEFE
jgi:hypothetical protein